MNHQIKKQAPISQSKLKLKSKKEYVMDFINVIKFKNKMDFEIKITIRNMVII